MIFLMWLKQAKKNNRALQVLHGIMPKYELRCTKLQTRCSNSKRKFIGMYQIVFLPTTDHFDISIENIDISIHAFIISVS